MSTLTPIAGSPPPAAVSAPDEAGGGVGSAVASAASAAAVSQDPYVNPQLQVDPESGVVIFQYRDDAGKIVRQVPSEYELRSYQQGQHTGKTGSV